MVRVSVLYQRSEDSHFDLDYYCKKHMKLVWEVLGSRGLLRAEVDAGQPGLDGSPAPYMAIGHIYFESVESFQQAFAEDVQALFDDVPNYTNITPVLQVNETEEILAD